MESDCAITKCGTPKQQPKAISTICTTENQKVEEGVKRNINSDKTRKKSKT